MKDNFGEMTKEEREGLCYYLEGLSELIVQRHKDADPDEISQALYDLQDYLGNISVNDDDTGLDLDWILED